MSYREPLPDGCPPEDAMSITEPQEVYRLVRTNPPTYEDFQSQRALKPTRKFTDITECQARGLSVHTQRKDCLRVLKLPPFRGCLPCRVHLQAGAGSIQRTGSRSHCTWWPLLQFDILLQCIVEAP